MVYALNMPGWFGASLHYRRKVYREHFYPNKVVHIAKHIQSSSYGELEITTLVRGICLTGENNLPSKLNRLYKT